jgi:hypothetical protein
VRVFTRRQRWAILVAALVLRAGGCRGVAAIGPTEETDSCAALVAGLRKAVADDATEWVDANIVRLLLDRYDGGTAITNTPATPIRYGPSVPPIPESWYR